MVLIRRVGAFAYAQEPVQEAEYASLALQETGPQKRKTIDSKSMSREEEHGLGKIR